MIHPNAMIAPGAQIGKDVEIGPFAVIEKDVVIGDRCKIGPHAFITGHTTIGAGTEVHTGASIGDTPQDLSYKGEISYTEIGENCLIREYVTVHRGAAKESRTVIGNHVLLMAMSHIGHDSVLEDNVVVGNSTLLAGHVHVARNAFVSANCMVHQFCRIGRLAMVGAGNGLAQDVPPFALVQLREIRSANVVGIRRAGFSLELRNAIEEMIKIYSLSRLPRPNAIERILAEIPDSPERQEFIDFALSTARGILPGYRKKNY